MTDTDLKPCPFCGGEKLLALKPTCHVSTPYDPSDRMFPAVRCMTCCAEVPGKDNSGPRDNRSTETAIAAWNTRPSPTREEIAVNPLEWTVEVMDHRKTDGSLKGHLFEHFDAETSNGWRYGFIRMTDGKGNHKTILNDRDSTEVDGITAAKAHYKRIHERRVLSFVKSHVALTPSPVAGWRDFHDWWSTGGHAMDPEPDVSWYDKRRDFAEMAFNAARTPVPGQQPATEQPSDPWTFDEPYSLKRDETALSGNVFWLMSNGVSIASYAVSNWGSEDACIKAAWRHAYEPEQPSVAEAALLKRVAAHLALNAHIEGGTSEKVVAHNVGVDSAIAEILKLVRGETALRTLQGDG